MCADSSLDRLLQHPSLWRGRSAARIATYPTGFPALDEALPGGGWPRVGLIELLIPQAGVGELRLLLPALASLGRIAPARWCAWIAPPFEPHAAALAAHGLTLERTIVAHTETPLWAFEQALRSGACEVALAWPKRVSARALQRLQLAAEQGRALGVLFRSLHQARTPSAAMLRITLAPRPAGIRVHLLKSRGGARSAIELQWSEALPEPRA